MELRAAIEIAGGTLESPAIEFGNDPDSILVEHLLASVSQHQRQKNGEQTKNRMQARTRNGYWTLQAPVGYRYERVSGRGKMLIRDEPVASVIQEALEGYASGRFGTQADIMRFLQANPVFPKGSRGTVTNQRVSGLLSQCLYAGYLEMPSWDIPLQKAQHEALISFQTWQRIQERLAGGFYAPRKNNVSEDFPLRGFVECDDCGTPLTACWSKGSHQKHPYYLCPKRGCTSYGKSIRRAKIEGEFEEVLKALVPSESMMKVAQMMFRDLWDHRLAQRAAQAKAINAQVGKVQKQIDGLLDRIADMSVVSVMNAMEQRIEKLEREKIALKERASEIARPKTSYERTLRTALAFLATLESLGFGAARPPQDGAQTRFYPALEIPAGKRV